MNCSCSFESPSTNEAHQEQKHWPPSTQRKENARGKQTIKQDGQRSVACCWPVQCCPTVLPSDAVNWVGKFHRRNNSSIASGIQWNNPPQQRLNNFMTDWLDRHKQKWSDSIHSLPLMAQELCGWDFYNAWKVFLPSAGLKNPIRLSRTVECPAPTAVHWPGRATCTRAVKLVSLPTSQTPPWKMCH